MSSGLTNKDELPGRVRYELEMLESTAINFGSRFINDGAVRRKYVNSIKDSSKEIIEMFETGKYTEIEAAEAAHYLRNQLLQTSRKHSSDLGRALAEKAKNKAISFPVLQERKSQDLYSRTFSSLSQEERGRVYVEMVNSSGRNRRSVTKVAKILGPAGKLLVLLSLSITTYDILHAKNKSRALVYNGVSLGSGVAGSMASGSAAGLACGPGAPFCIGLGAFIGGIIGTFGAQYLMNKTSISHY